MTNFNAEMAKANVNTYNENLRNQQLAYAEEITNEILKEVEKLSLAGRSVLSGYEVGFKVNVKIDDIVNNLKNLGFKATAIQGFVTVTW